MKNLLKCQEIMIIQQNFIRLFASAKILYIFWHRFIKTKNTSIPQKINFVGKLEEDDESIMFFVTEKQQKLF